MIAIAMRTISAMNRICIGGRAAPAKEDLPTRMRVVVVIRVPSAIPRPVPQRKESIRAVREPLVMKSSQLLITLVR
jgi:hypothetical protein